MNGKIKCTKTYRYTTFGDHKNADFLIYVLHGYGQLAPYFIRKFHGLPSNYFVIAPEGMHRFYLNGSSGRVGASWMTKEEREDDISDNLCWLSSLHDEITARKSFKKVFILGFSQGGATAARWYQSGKISADHLMIWASVYPPDLEPNNEIQLHEKEHFFFVGTNDEFYNAAQQNDLLSFYSSKGYKTVHFEGKHDIDLTELINVLMLLT
jgi:predicted esterase